MSALLALLGTPPGHPRSAGNVVRTLVLPDGVLLHLQEDEYAEEIIIFSRPGLMPETDFRTQQAARPWRHVLRHPRFPGVRCSLAVELQTRQVYLADVWARAALDATLLDESFSDHAMRHRAWRRVLNAATPHKDY